MPRSSRAKRSAEAVPDEAPAPASKRAKPRSPTSRPASASVVASTAPAPSQRRAAAPPLDTAPASLSSPASAAAAATAIRARLLWPTGAPAATLRLRPSAAAVAADLTRVVCDAVATPHGSTTALLLGPRGAGKTLVVERVLVAARARVGCTSTLAVGATLPEGAPPPRLGVVRLSGLLHWEERVAFREAARQLCAQFGLPFERSASHDENIGFFAAVLAQLATAGRAAVFVLDELDAFARRARQAFLYNLCDRVASAGVAAAVVGVSARFDCLDLLEKRVRSRFLRERPLCLLSRAGREEEGEGEGEGEEAVAARRPPPPSSASATTPFDPDSGPGILLESLSLPPSLATQPGWPESASPAADVAAWNAAAVAALTDPTVAPALADADDFGLLSPGDAAVAAVAVASTAALAGRAPLALDVAAALASLRARQRDLVAAVASASVLEVYMLACLVRAAAAAGDKPPCFDAAYALYASLSAGGWGPDADRGRGAAWAAFQRLVAAGLVGPGEGRGGAGPSASAAAAGALRPHSRVEVRPSAEEVAAGARAHGRGLGQVAHWLERGGAVGTRKAAAVDV